MLRNENGHGCGSNNTPADGWHACVSSLRLVWNYDDTQGAGILFSVFLIRKQEQAEWGGRRRMIRLPWRAALRVADNHIQITAVDPIMLQPGTFYCCPWRAQLPVWWWKWVEVYLLCHWLRKTLSMHRFLNLKHDLVPWSENQPCRNVPGC